MSLGRIVVSGLLLSLVLVSRIQACEPGYPVSYFPPVFSEDGRCHQRGGEVLQRLLPDPSSRNGIGDDRCALLPCVDGEGAERQPTFHVQGG